MSELDKQKATLIELGPDSQVYRQGNLVYKFYCQRADLSLEHIQACMNVTNQAADKLKTHPLTGTIRLDGQNFGFVYSVNRVIEVDQEDSLKFTEIPGQVPFTISEYIPGPSLDYFTSIFFRNDYEKAIKPLVRPERQFLTKLASTHLGSTFWFQKKDPTPMLQDQPGHLEQLSGSLSRSLGAEGIKISDGNVKIRFDTRDQKVRFIVTDICAGVNQLKV